MTLTIDKIPFHIEMRCLYRPGDRFNHEVKFGVVGVSEPTTVVISSDYYGKPITIEERIQRGVVDLPSRLLDLLAIKCFRLMASAIIEHGGESGWWTLADISLWVRRGCESADAEQILRELSRHTSPEWIVRSTCLVADDDAI